MKNGEIFGKPTISRPFLIVVVIQLFSCKKAIFTSSVFLLFWFWLIGAVSCHSTFEYFLKRLEYFENLLFSNNVQWHFMKGWKQLSHLLLLKLGGKLLMGVKLVFYIRIIYFCIGELQTHRPQHQACPHPSPFGVYKCVHR